MKSQHYKMVDVVTHLETKRSGGNDANVRAFKRKQATMETYTRRVILSKTMLSQ